MPARPHIVIFNPDQWRGDVMGHLGNPAAVTPNLDALVQSDAVSFRYAACQNPVCTPSRCSFMTGWYPHVRGHRTMFHMLHPERGEPNLLTTLKDAGYFVWWAGKNDLVPAQDGYQRCCDVKYEPAAEDFRRWDLTPRRGLHDWTDWRGEPGSDTYYSFFAGRLDAGGERIYADGDWAYILGTIDFIRSAPRDRPLCLYLPLAYPHPPYGVEEPFFSMIDRARLPARASAPEDWHGKPALLHGIAQRQNMTDWTEGRWTELRATYYGMCARVDHQFGLVLQALRDAGFYDETAVLFFSDHGDFTGDYGLVEKTQNTFEDCLVRVPLVVKPPRAAGVKPRVSEAMAELVDIAATVYDLAGIEPGYTHFGRSLLPVVRGQTDEHRDAVFCEGGRLDGETHCMERESGSQMNPAGLYWPRVGLQQFIPEHGKAIMCRTGQFKYVLRLYEADELYDLQRDPQELRNIAAEPGYAATLVQLRADAALVSTNQRRGAVPAGSAVVGAAVSTAPSRPRYDGNMNTPDPRRTFIEKFDNGPCGWISWGPTGLFGVEIRDSMAVSRSPWWVDYNHGPPGAGYLHMPFMLHLRPSPEYGLNPNVVKVAGPNPFIKGGFSTNLANAKITVRLKGQVNLLGAKMVLLAQNNLPTPERPVNWVNQVLSAQPLSITPDWSSQTIQLVPDQKQWTNMGSHRTRADRYGVGPIARLLEDVDDIIFVFTPIDAAPAKPIDGDPHLLRAGADYEVDRSRLPDGTVMLDEVKIEYA